MHYRHGFELSAEGKVTEPERVSFPLTPGRVIDVSLTFPAGCSGLVGVRIMRGSLQLYPLTVGEWIVSDDYTVHFPADFELDERPYALTLEGYNVDEKYNHTVSVSITLQTLVDPSQAVVDALTLGMPALGEFIVSGNKTINVGTLETIDRIETNIIALLEQQVQETKRINERLYSDMSMEELARI